MKFIIYNPVTNLFDFFINSIKYEFNKKNIEIIDLNSENKLFCENIDYKKDILFIIINPHFIFNNEIINNDIKYFGKKFRYKILYLTEPINFIIEKKIFQDIINIIKPFCLWTYTVENLYKLNINIPVFKIFPNYNETYSFINNITINNLKNRINNKIVFIGKINDNRKNICDEFDNNKYFINFYDKWSKEEWSSILENHLFYLNIHRRIGCKSFESFRIIPILSNGGVIFSEKVNNIEENIFNKFNIIFTERHNLFNTFINYINNINYEDIYDKTILFRNNMKDTDNINNFLKYFKSL
jgi:hypothetical protein